MTGPEEHGADVAGSDWALDGAATHGTHSTLPVTVIGYSFSTCNKIWARGVVLAGSVCEGAVGPASVMHDLGNAVHAVRTQCEVLDMGKYSHPSYLLVVKH